MTIPTPVYTNDSKGQPLIQLPAKDWEAFLDEVNLLRKKVDFQHKLERAFSEIKQIQTKQKPVSTLTDFLDEL